MVKKIIIILTILAALCSLMHTTFATNYLKESKSNEINVKELLKDYNNFDSTENTQNKLNTPVSLPEVEYEKNIFEYVNKELKILKIISMFIILLFSNIFI